MAEKATRFAYLMDRMGVKPSVLSEHTGIDKTLISRWKTGRRRLAPTSQHVKDIVSYMLSQEDAEEKIGKTLLAYGLGDETGTLGENLVFWLSEQDIPDAPAGRNIIAGVRDEYTANFRVFLGNQGIHNALEASVDYVMSCPGGKEIICVIKANQDHFIGDLKFLDILVSRLHAAFRRGVKLKIISYNGFKVGEIAEISGLWHSAHLRDNIRSFYCDMPTEQEGEFALLAAKDHFCLKMTDDTAQKDGLYAALYTDSATVRQVYHMCTRYAEKISAQSEAGFFEEPPELLREMDWDQCYARDLYLYADVPALGTIPAGHVHRHAQATQKESAEKTGPLEILFQTPDRYHSDAAVRHIYCADSIDRLLMPGRNRHTVFSALYGRKINHSRKHLKEQLKDIYRWLERNRNYEVVFLPARLYEKVPMDFYSLKGTFAAGWLKDCGKSTGVKTGKEAAALHGYAGLLWDEIPQVYKSRGSSIKMLHGWIERCK